MTKAGLKKYASHVRKEHLEPSDYSSWVDIEHDDGTELSFTNSAFEHFSEDPKDENAAKWVIVWTLNHGTFLYPEKDLVEWSAGDLEPDDTAIILPS